MQVTHRLSGVRTVVRQKPKAILDLLLLRDGLRSAVEVAENLQIVRFYVGYPGNVLSGNDQNMNRRLRV
jgi:hypothetical protein